MESTASALHAERIRSAVASENIANVHLNKSLDGKPYQRKNVVFESVLAAHTNGIGITGNEPQKVQIARIVQDHRPPLMVPMEGHPDADENGMVAMPNINIHEEMADAIVSQRAYEANLAVVRNARSMALQTLNIGKR